MNFNTSLLLTDLYELLDCAYKLQEYAGAPSPPSPPQER
jgi:hypothetical protein